MMYQKKLFSIQVHVGRLWLDYLVVALLTFFDSLLPVVVVGRTYCLRLFYLVFMFQ